MLSNISVHCNFIRLLNTLVLSVSNGFKDVCDLKRCWMQSLRIKLLSKIGISLANSNKVQNESMVKSFFHWPLNNLLATARISIVANRNQHLDLNISLTHIQRQSNSLPMNLKLFAWFQFYIFMNLKKFHISISFWLEKLWFNLEQLVNWLIQ